MMYWRDRSGAARDWVLTLCVAVWLVVLHGGFVRGAEWYVAPKAGADGEGTFNNPWALQVAMDRATPVGRGDTVWLRGGIYQSNYISYLTGEPDRPVVVRPYQDEKVLFDGSPLFPEAYVLTIEGAWTIYRDFEVQHSAIWSDPVTTPVAIQCVAPNVKLVNLVIHDAGQGIGFWRDAVDSEIYGCLIYYNGADAQEHGIYMQNEVGTKHVRDCIIFHNSGFGIHAYSRTGFSLNYDLQGNVLFHNGGDTGELFVGGYYPTDNLTVISNYCLARPGLGKAVIQLDDRDHSSNPNGQAEVQGNILVGGAGFSAQDFSRIGFSDNLVWNDTLHTVCRPPPGVALAAYAWDRNRYFGLGGFRVGEVVYDFPEWIGLGVLDQESSYRAAGSVGQEVAIRPNEYEAKRAHVVVYNWDLQDNVRVDLAGVLERGDTYRLRNVQDYLGPAVLEGTYVGEPLWVPMTNLAVALPGRQLPVPAPTGPLFGAFVVEALSTNEAPINTPPILAPLPDRTVVEGQTITFQVSATDPDSFENPLTFFLESGAPLGVTLAAGSGVFRFTPSEAQGPGEHLIRVRVEDNDFPNRSATGEFQLTVEETNTAPRLPPLPTQVLTEGSVLVLEGRALDTDIPPDGLSYSLGPGAPEGVRINPVNGQILWSPTEQQGPQQHTFHFRVTDDGQPALSSTGVVRVIVTEVNQVPRLSRIADIHATEGVSLTVPVQASDPDLPANELKFSLDPEVPEGAWFDPIARAVRWTPTGPGATYPFTVRVRDDGWPALEALSRFSVTVHASPEVRVDDPGGGVVELRWGAAPGSRYRIAYKESLADPDWLFLPLVLLAGDDQLSIRLPRGEAGQRFYRVVVLNQ